MSLLWISKQTMVNKQWKHFRERHVIYYFQSKPSSILLIKFLGNHIVFTNFQSFLYPCVAGGWFGLNKIIWKKSWKIAGTLAYSYKSNSAQQELLTFLKLRLLLAIQWCKDFWKPFKPWRVGIHWIFLDEYPCAMVSIILQVFCIILYWPN